MKCYKVVNKSFVPDTYVSAVACGTYKIVYELDKIVKPVDGTLGIFVFKELSHAKVFLRDNWNLNMRILECDGKNIKPWKARSCIAVEEIRHFWEKICLNKNRRKNMLANINYYNCPIGTYICSELKPLKVISHA